VKLMTWLPGDQAFRRAFYTVGACGGALTAGAAILRDGSTAVSVVTGAAIGLSNLYVLAKIVAAVAVPHRDARENGAFVWGVIALGKLMILCGIMWLLMTRRLVDPIPLVLGYGSLPMGIAIGGVVSDKTDPGPPREPPPT